ncbi:MAG TPA: S8 family serine peptidase, partial [Candidatus Angelobacter sp.]|nr:S8 family serine peptidase [Candidatus Angelobacter sp.]
MITTLGRKSKISLLAIGSLVLFLSLQAFAAKIGGGLDKQLAAASPTTQLQVIITFNGTTVSAAQIAAVRALGIQQGIIMRSLPIMGVLATPQQVTALSSRPDVISLWANRQLKYYNYEATALTGIQKLRNDPVLIKRNKGLPYLGRGITVEVNDSGIDATHMDLQFGTHVVQNVQGATNLQAQSSMLPVTYTENVPDTDTGGHGTHVAGSVGGNGARSNGKYAGAAPGANIVGYGSGAAIFVLDGVGGFDYAISHQGQYGIRVITNSFGLSDPRFDPADPLNVASYLAYKRGIVVLFAAGNDGPGVDTLNPYAKAPWVIGVGAGNKQGHLSTFSSRGLAGDTQTFTILGDTWTLQNQPTIVSPGEFIISTRATGETDSLIAGEAGPQEDANRIEPANLPFYVVLTGTSQATPHAAGIVALVLEANPSLSPLEVKQILQQTATNMPGRSVSEAGAGYINAYAAVDRASSSRNYGGTVNALRAFNSSAQVNIGKTPLSIDYNPVIAQSASGNSFSFTVPAGTNQVAVGIQCLGVQNAVNPTGNPIDMFLIAPDGTKFESQVPVAFTVFTGRSVVADNPMPGTWTVLLQALVQEQGIDVSTVPETVQGLIYQTQNQGFTGLNDIAGNPAASSI